MRVYKSGHGARVLLMLAMTVLAVAAIFYGLGALEGWGRAIAVGLAAGLLLTSSWVLVWVLRRNEERLRARALNDSLTDLPNRFSFVERVDRTLSEAARESRPIAVLLVDLDDFEEINHTLGHEAGDQLLAIVGERLEESGGFAARLCGDEFAVLLGDIPDKSSAASAAKRIGEALKAPIEVDGSEVLTSASIGVAVADPEQEDGPEDLLRKADVAMHAAKRKGKARHKVFDPGADTTTTSGRAVAEAEMRRAVEEGEFRVHYQPLIALGTGKVRGFEALVRWQHPVYGLISPEDFVPLAEQTGLIVPIGRWVLREACRQAKLWQEEHPSNPPLLLSVNVSARQFAQASLAEEILRTLQSRGLDPRHLILEITEGVMVHDVSATSALRELKGSGIRLAMDDFGTGYSNLSYVKRLPVGIIKIDRSYVSGLGNDAEDTAIVHATAAFAKALGLGLMAEGIENAEQLARLREVGCELGQGHHFAKPLPSEEVPAFLDAHRSTITGSG
jgi:diguanylate cyclase (GGDEF)-like protein